MTVVSCPKCDDHVSLPAGASPRAVVRCPLCQEEFPLAEILDAMPPALIVLEDPDAQVAPETSPLPSVAGGTAEFDELALAPPETRTGAPAFSIQPSVAPATTTTSPRRRRAAPGAKRTKSPVKEVMKIVLGGVAGLVIGQAILWWMPWTNWRRDPVGLGPKISSVVPWIVPQQFHAKPASTTATPDGSSPAGPSGAVSATGLPKRSFVDPNAPAKPRSARKHRNGPTTRKPATSPTAPAKNASSDRRPPADSGSGGLGQLLPEEPRPDAGTSNRPEITPDLLDDLNVDLDALTMLDPAAETNPKTTESEATGRHEPATVRLAGAPKPTAQELQAAVDDANAAIQSWLAKPNADSYRSFAKLGRAMALAERRTPAAIKMANRVLDLFGDDPQQVEGIEKAGAHLLTTESQHEAGILLAGTVTAAHQKGGITEIHLQVESLDGPVCVYDDAAQADDYRAGSKALVLGVIIEDPSKNLIGYRGDAKSVVWSGVARSLPEP